MFNLSKHSQAVQPLPSNKGTPIDAVHEKGNLQTFKQDVTKNIKTELDKAKGKAAPTLQPTKLTDPVQKKEWPILENANTFFVFRDQIRKDYGPDNLEGYGLADNLIARYLKGLKSYNVSDKEIRDAIANINANPALDALLPDAQQKGLEFYQTQKPLIDQLAMEMKRQRRQNRSAPGARKGRAFSNETIKTAQAGPEGKKEMERSTWVGKYLDPLLNYNPEEPDKILNNNNQTFEEVKAEIIDLASPAAAQEVDSIIKDIVEMDPVLEGNDARETLEYLYDNWIASEAMNKESPIMAESKKPIHIDLTNQVTNNMTKTASDHFGHEYVLYGPTEKRICPKLRGKGGGQPGSGDVVSEYICRHHCLDGIVIDDNKTVCGEAVWRANVMDKFSREYVNEDGDIVGGYLNRRFEINRNVPEETKMRLKPGETRKPRPAEVYGNMEARMQAMREKEGEKRGYRPETDTSPPFNWTKDVDQNNVETAQSTRDKQEENSGHWTVQYTNKNEQENNPKLAQMGYLTREQPFFNDPDDDNGPGFPDDNYLDEEHRTSEDTPIEKELRRISFLFDQEFKIIEQYKDSGAISHNNAEQLYTLLRRMWYNHNRISPNDVGKWQARPEQIEEQNEPLMEKYRILVKQTGMPSPFVDEFNNKYLVRDVPGMPSGIKPAKNNHKLPKTAGTKGPYDFQSKKLQYSKYRNEQLEYALKDADQAVESVGRENPDQGWYQDDVHTIAEEISKREKQGKWTGQPLSQLMESLQTYRTDLTYDKQNLPPTAPIDVKHTKTFNMKQYNLSKTAEHGFMGQMSSVEQAKQFLEDLVERTRNFDQAYQETIKKFGPQVAKEAADALWNPESAQTTQPVQPAQPAGFGSFASSDQFVDPEPCPKCKHHKCICKFPPDDDNKEGKKDAFNLRQFKKVAQMTGPRGPVGMDNPQSDDLGLSPEFSDPANRDDEFQQDNFIEVSVENPALYDALFGDAPNPLIKQELNKQLKEIGREFGTTITLPNADPKKLDFEVNPMHDQLAGLQDVLTEIVISLENMLPPQNPGLDNLASTKQAQGANIPVTDDGRNPDAYMMKQEEMDFNAKKTCPGCKRKRKNLAAFNLNEFKKAQTDPAPSWTNYYKVDEVIETLDLGPNSKQIERELLKLMPKAYDYDTSSYESPPEPDAFPEYKLSVIWPKLTPQTQQALQQAYASEMKKMWGDDPMHDRMMGEDDDIQAQTLTRSKQAQLEDKKKRTKIDPYAHETSTYQHPDFQKAEQDEKEWSRSLEPKPQTPKPSSLNQQKEMPMPLNIDRSVIQLFNGDIEQFEMFWDSLNEEQQRIIRQNPTLDAIRKIKLEVDSDVESTAKDLAMEN